MEMHNFISLPKPNCKPQIYLKVIPLYTFIPFVPLQYKFYNQSSNHLNTLNIRNMSKNVCCPFVQIQQIKFVRDSQMSQQEGSQQKELKSNNNSQRQFGCPCGKTYLSYPALFTHVKQKHDGKPPGDLIKPKTEKTRGRPKIHVDIPDDDLSDGAFNLQEQIESAIDGTTVEYDEEFQLSTSGSTTCQDVATIFIKKLSYLSPENKKVINCFLNQMKYHVDKNFGQNFWNQQKPADIIDIANKMSEDHKQVSEKFPLQQIVFKELMLVLFRWMFKSKFTDHKLIRRMPTKNL